MIFVNIRFEVKGNSKYAGGMSHLLVFYCNCRFSPGTKFLWFEALEDGHLEASFINKE